MESSFEHIPPIRPGDEVLRRRRRPPRRRLRVVPNVPAVFRFIGDIVAQTPFLPILSILVALLLLVSTGVYFTEHEANPGINSFGDAIWWSVSAMQTMGFNHPPMTFYGRLVGGIGTILCTFVFWGMIIASVTAYFMRPRQRLSRQLVATVEYNLEKLDELSIEELEVLKETTDRLIEARIEQLNEESGK